MMVLLGTIVNAISIIVGSLFGLFLTNIGEKYKETVVKGIGLVAMLIGIQMALGVESIIFMLLSMLLGSIVGEAIRLEDRLYYLGNLLGKLFNTKQGKSEITEGFVAATLLFTVGAMAIIGALDSGLRGDHELLYTKSVLDGFSSFVLSTTLGIGVIFSALPVFLFQGSISLLATQVEAIIPSNLFNALLDNITGVGGLLIVAISLNILGITKIRVTNLLPALVVICLFVVGRHLLQ